MMIVAVCDFLVKVTGIYSRNSVIVAGNSKSMEKEKHLQRNIFPMYLRLPVLSAV